jgi:4-hydroxy-4-methyl-2-oxoglutarate aldolase
MKSKELCHQLASLSTTHFCDASPDTRIFDTNIRRFSSPASWAGRAFTVLSEGDLFPVMQAIELAKEGDVLVITAGTQRALAGEIFSTAAQKKGLAGIEIMVEAASRDSPR